MLETARRLTAIINPKSGAGLDPAAATRRVVLLKQMLDRVGLEASIHVTERGGHARDLAAAAAAEGSELVIVWGGDGTLNEAGSALVGTSTALALVPAGSGNGFAAALGVPREPSSAIETALNGQTRHIDVGIVNGRPFLNVAGIGFDAWIAELFNTRARGSRGRWPYFVIGVREGCRYCCRDYELTLDGDTLRTRAMLIAFANGREYGVGARIAPAARLDDGWLDVTIVEDRPLLSRFCDTRYLLTGAIARAPGVRTRRVRHASIGSDGPMQYHLDGEPAVSVNRLEVSILPGALKVRV
jgi:diacylglycerol kinase (ATP)